MANPLFIGFLAVSALLIIGILYWFKPPPPIVLISSSILWNRLLKERKRSTLLDKLRWLLSLLLASTVAIFLVLASGAPEFFPTDVSEIKNVSIVIDNSGTMATVTKNGKSRWHHALGIAEGIIVESHPGAEFLILDTGGQVASRGITNKWDALENLKKLDVTFVNDGRFPVLPEREARTVFISDGVSPMSVPSGVEIISVFEVAENVGITAVTLSSGRNSTSPGIQGVVQISNGSLISKEVVLRVSGLGGVNMSESLSLRPGSSSISEIDLERFRPGPLRLSVTSVRDALSEDDLAYAVIPSRSLTRVTLVTLGNVYLKTALEAMASVELTIDTPQTYDPNTSTEIYIFDRFIPETLPPRPILYFSSSEIPFEGLSDPEILLAQSGSNLEEHFILEGMTLSDLAIEKIGDPSNIFEDSQILWAHGDIPLISVNEGLNKAVQVNFSLQDSNFPLQPAFPIFLMNTIGWVLESAYPEFARPGRVGIPMPDAVVVDLEGNPVETRLVDQTTVFQGQAPNLYSIDGTDERIWMPVNLTDLDFTLVNESGLDAELLSGINVDENGSLGESSEPGLWRLFVIFALSLIVFEWLTYHRRITV